MKIQVLVRAHQLREGDVLITPEGSVPIMDIALRRDNGREVMVMRLNEEQRFYLSADARVLVFRPLETWL